MEASRKGNVIPLHKCIFSDHLTPVLAYRCLIKEADKETPSFLFESVEPGFRASSVVRPILLIFYLVKCVCICFYLCCFALNLIFRVVIVWLELSR